MAHLVGLPEQGHLLGDSLFGRAALGRRDPCVVEQDNSVSMRMCESRTLRRVVSVGCAVRTS